MDGEQLALRAGARTRHARRARLSAHIRVTERVERRTVEAAHGGAAHARGLGSGRVVQAPDGLPGLAGVLEEYRLTVVPSGDERVFRSPGEGYVRKGGALDRDNGWCARVYDSDRRIMAWCILLRFSLK